MQTKPPQTVQMTKAEQPPERKQTIPQRSPKTAQPQTNSQVMFSPKTKTARSQTMLPEPPKSAELQQPKTASQEQKPTISPPKKAVLQKTQAEP